MYFQVVFDGDRAVGVKYLKDGVENLVKARREVILSAGAIGSPHLLLLSGVGPKEHIQAHGVGLFRGDHPDRLS